MTPDRTRIKRHRYYDPDVEKAVPKDAIVLDLASFPGAEALDGFATPQTWLRHVAYVATTLTELKVDPDAPNVRLVRWIADQIEAQTTGGAS